MDDVVLTYFTVNCSHLNVISTMEHANPPDCTRDEASSPNPYIVLNDPDSTAEIPSETPVNPSSEVEKPSDGRWKPSRGGKKVNYDTCDLVAF